MNPDEAWIGKVLVAGIIGLALWAITALIQSKSEGARRTRIVIGGAFGLGVAWVVTMVAGPVAFIIVLAIISAGIWIAKGTKK